MTNIYGGSSLDLTLLEAKTQYQSVPTTNTTNFQGSLTINGVPVSGGGGLFVLRAGDSMTGALDMKTNDISNIDDLSGPVNSRKADDIVSCTGASANNSVAIFSGVTGKVITDSGATLSQYLPLAGGTMSGAIIMGTNDITGVDDFAGPVNSRKADNIVSCTGTSTNLNIAVMSGTSGKVVTDGGATVASLLSKAGGTMTGAINMGQQEINNVSAIRTTDTRILIGSSASIAANGVSKTTVIGDAAVQSGASGNHVLIGGSALIPSSTGNMVVVGAGASGTGASNVVIGGGTSTVSDPGNCIIIGSSATANSSEAIVIGAAASSTGASSVVLGRLAVSSANNAHVLGRNINNAIGDSFLIGDSNLANIRSSSAVCDLGTTALPFQRLYLNTGLDAGGATALGIGNVNATSINIGRSTVVSTVTGIFAATQPTGSWYCSTNYSYSFTAATPIVTPPGGGTTNAGSLVEFTNTDGILTYTGTRTRTVKVEYNVTMTVGAVGADMIFFNSKNGSTTIGSTQTQAHVQVSATIASTQINVNFSDMVSLATNDTITLASQCATTTNAPVYNFVSCNVFALVN